MTKKIFSFLIAAVLTVGAGFCGRTYAADDAATERIEALETAQDTAEYWASEAVASVKLSSQAAILIDSESGEVLFEQNADERRSLASVTKIMSALLVFEALDSGKISLDDNVTCSTHASRMGGSQIWLKENETMTVHELIKAMLIGSANDATCALAEHIGGSESVFVAMMNERAAQLGMTGSCFVNTNGLPAEGHYSTARDISVMSRELMKHELVFDYTTVWMDSLRDGQTQLVNTNKLIRFYNGATGLKTGYTDAAGYCISATATRGDLSLVAVTLGAPTGAERNADAKCLLDYGFTNYVSVTPEMPSELLAYPVEKGEKETVGVTAGKASPILLSRGREGEIAVNVPETRLLSAPVKKGDVVGEITVSLGDETLQKVQIYASEDVARMTFGMCFRRLLEQLLTFM